MKTRVTSQRWRTTARSIVSTRIPIKVPANRSYTRTPFVKSVDMRTCAHVRYIYIRSYTHTSTPTNGFRISLGARQDMPQGWWKTRKRTKLSISIREITFVNWKGDYAGGHYNRCLWFVSKYNVPATIFAMRTNGCFHFF